jgi:Ca2+-binding EF-hand superfamily protein
VKEFIESLGVQRTVVSEEVFEDMDTSNDGTVSFKEFTLLTWRFCTRGLDSIAEFAFDIYDTDNSEQLTKPEIRELIIEAYGKITEKHNVSDV